MKIALVAQPFDSVLPPDQNSIGLIIYNTARSLVGKADVTVYVPAGSGIDTAGEVDGIHVVPVSVSLDRRIELFMSRYPRLFGSIKVLSAKFYYWFYALRIGLRVRRDRPDVVHVLNFPQFARVIRKLARKSTRVSLEMQCDWLTQWDLGEVLPGLDACDFVWGVSSHVTDLIKARFPALKPELGISFNGFQPERFSGAQRREPADGQPTIIFVGRVSPEKGVHVLLEAVAELISDFPALRLRLIGPRTQLGAEFIVDISEDPLVRELGRFYDGRVTTDYQQHLDKLIERFGLGRSVTFTGPIYQDDLVGEYLGATLLINPSFSESFGMTLVEAMATGCPVIGSRVGGMRDIVVENESGLLVDAGDAPGLARAMHALLADPDRRHAIAGAGQARAVSTFSWQARADRLLDRFSPAQS